jgi:hypothetical protein
MQSKCNQLFVPGLVGAPELVALLVAVTTSACHFIKTMGRPLLVLVARGFQKQLPWSGCDGYEM